MAKRLMIALALLLATIPAGAQFYSYGNDPASVKWHTISTDNYRIVYPAEMDSLARVYANSLEKYTESIGKTVGYEPNEAHKRPHPVILHPYTAYTNGMVMWAPRRMELLTIEDAYDPEPTQWVTQLAVHESRHVAQMQFIRGSADFRILGYLTGQMAGSLGTIYPGLSFLEGDAVVAETALTNTGRGRTADFMEYYKVAFANGDYRNYWRWRWGSQRHYTPDYYRVGYLLHAGMRNVYDSPEFTNTYFERLFRSRTKPWMNLQGTVKEVSGKKFKEAFREIENYFQEEWTQNEAQRGPFLEADQLSRTPKRYEILRGLTFIPDTLYAIRSGIARPTDLVYINEDGRPKHVKYFSGNSSRLAYSQVTGRTYWTELIPSRRWSLRNYSNLRYLQNGHIRTLTEKHRYYNPAPSPTDSLVAVVEYLPDGACNLAVVHESDGHEVELYRAPDGYQPVEVVWVNGQLYASAIDENGFSIYDPATWEPLFQPGTFKINRLFEKDGRIWFTSDMNGVNELYSLEISSGSVWQETSTRFGANEFAFKGDTLYFAAPTVDGRNIYKVAEDALDGTRAELAAKPYPSAEKLSSQEPLQPDEDFEANISEVSEYSKLKNLFRVHSWAPLYYNYEFTSMLAYDNTETAASPGAMMFFQNDLGTSYGSIGVSLLDSDFKNFRPAGHLQYVWAGWAPKIELRADFNDRGRYGYYWMPGQNYTSYRQSIIYVEDSNYLNLSATTYLPINLSSGGWTKGIIPEVKFAWCNDVFMVLHKYKGATYIKPDSYNGIFINPSIKAYSYLPVAESAIYPHLGIGAEVGSMILPFMHENYPNTLYGQVYGYIPGFWINHGIRLKVNGSMSYGGDFSKTRSYGGTFNYAMPFAPVDWTFLCPAFYIRNFELIAHASYEYTKSSSLSTDDSTSEEELYLGGSLRVHLSNFLWVPFDTRIGVQYLYNPVHEDLSTLGFVFSIDI